MENLKTFDEFIKEELKDPELQLNYLLTALEEFAKDGDFRCFLSSLKRVAEAQGSISKLSRDSQISRQSLYKLFSAKSMPKFDTVETILNALGFRLSVKPLKQAG
jgi:probable addiction module antidote protein